MNITTLGIDIAKNVFQVHGVDQLGKKIVNKAITKNKIPEFKQLQALFALFLPKRSEKL